MDNSDSSMFDFMDMMRADGCFLDLSDEEYEARKKDIKLQATKANVQGFTVIAGNTKVFVKLQNSKEEYNELQIVRGKINLIIESLGRLNLANFMDIFKEHPTTIDQYATKNFQTNIQSRVFKTLMLLPDEEGKKIKDDFGELDAYQAINILQEIVEEKLLLEGEKT